MLLPSPPTPSLPSFPLPLFPSAPFPVPQTLTHARRAGSPSALPPATSCASSGPGPGATPRARGPASAARPTRIAARPVAACRPACTSSWSAARSCPPLPRFSASRPGPARYGTHSPPAHKINRCRRRRCSTCAAENAEAESARRRRSRRVLAAGDAGRGVGRGRCAWRGATRWRTWRRSTPCRRRGSSSGPSTLTPSGPPPALSPTPPLPPTRPDALLLPRESM